MTDKRIDAASRIIDASPDTIYSACLDAQSVAAWRPPEGMRGETHLFEPHEGGRFRMSFIYADTADGTSHGKTTENADVFQGRFVALMPDRRIVEEVEFESDDPAFAGTMRITTTLTPQDDGTTEVAIACENVPEGISAEDHQVGMKSTLANLAAFTERAGGKTGTGPA